MQGPLSIPKRKYRAYKIPELKFEAQNLTSFAGLVIFQPLILGLELKNHLHECFRHFKKSRIFGHHVIPMLLIIHLLLGYRRLRDVSYYQGDPMVNWLLGLNQLPDPSTVSGALSDLDGMSIARVRELCRKLVIERLKKVAIHLVTLRLRWLGVLDSKPHHKMRAARISRGLSRGRLN